MIKFISYEASEYAVCLGKLTVEVDGVVLSFGSDLECFPRFWISGGGLLSDYSGSYTAPYELKHGWERDYTQYPKWIKDSIPEILEVMNDNIEWGCCGGCI